MEFFGAGDIVGCKPSSNRDYAITNEKNGFIGRVIGVDRGRNKITVELVQSKRVPFASRDFCVDAEHFYLLGNNYTISKIK